MTAPLANLLSLTEGQALFAVAAVFLAGVVRGFSGFGLSALVVAALLTVMPLVDIIAICLVLESTATLLLSRPAFVDADKGMVFGLIAGVLVGAPAGLALTTTAPAETTRVIALSLILILAVAQLSGARPAFLASRAGLYGSGVAAGAVQGAAGAGGLVVALYSLARAAPARVMRASLVMYLSITLLVNLVYYSLFCVLTTETVLKGVVLAVPVALGVLTGARLFSARLQPYYRPFCLSLLTGLAAAGLARAALS